jgi:hypothetical protein
MMENGGRRERTQDPFKPHLLFSENQSMNQAYTLRFRRSSKSVPTDAGTMVIFKAGVCEPSQLCFCGVIRVGNRQPANMKGTGLRIYSPHALIPHAAQTY